jgi:hypothetical protein
VLVLDLEDLRQSLVLLVRVRVNRTSALLRRRADALVVGGGGGVGVGESHGTVLLTRKVVAMADLVVELPNPPHARL